MNGTDISMLKTKYEIKMKFEIFKTYLLIGELYESAAS
jgi:hypothetical protein